MFDYFPVTTSHSDKQQSLLSSGILREVDLGDVASFGSNSMSPKDLDLHEAEAAAKRTEEMKKGIRVCRECFNTVMSRQKKLVPKRVEGWLRLYQVSASRAGQASADGLLSTSRPYKTRFKLVCRYLATWVPAQSEPVSLALCVFDISIANLPLQNHLRNSQSLQCSPEGTSAEIVCLRSLGEEDSRSARDAYHPDVASED